MPATHWIPERLVHDRETVSCRWLDIADVRYTDPSFDMTVARRRRDRPAFRLSPLSDLVTEAARVSAIEPSAFLFHVSRCGSTLFCQLWSLDTRAIVLAEVPILDELLRSDLPDRGALVAATLRLLGQRRFGDENGLFVKTDCWHIFHAAMLRRLYPETPFLLLYRSPEAVLGSHRKARGMHMVPGLLHHAPFEVAYDPARHSLDQHAAEVMALHYRAMLDVAASDGNSLLVCYDEGFPAAFLRGAQWLGQELDDGHRARLDERCGYHAKRPYDSFGPESVPSLRDVDFTTLRSLFDRLENARHAGSPW